MNDDGSTPWPTSVEDRLRLARVERLAEDPRSVPELVDALGDPSWAVRRAVVAALARAGDAAVAALLEVLDGPRDDETRLAAAVDALSASAAEQEEPLLRLARSARPPVVADVAQVLGRRRSDAAVPILVDLTGHPDDNVAVAAIEALGRIGGRGPVDALIALARSGNFFRTFPAIDVLGRSGDLRAVDALAPLLEAPLYAAEAVRALGRSGQAAAIAPLAGVLTRGPDHLLRAAALAIAELHASHARRYGSARAIERAVRDALSDGRPVRRIAQAVPGADGEEQDALCRVLGWQGTGDATAALLELLDLAPRPASEALRAVGHDVDAELVSALRSGDSARRVLLLPLLVGRESAVREAEACLDDPDPAVRSSACEVLTRIGDASAVRALFQHLGDPDARVSHAVAGAIQSLGSEETERLALAAAASPDHRTRRAALRIISYFGYASGIDALRDALASGDERLRDTALGGLPYLDDPRAVALLLEHAASPDPRARAGVMRALGQTAPEEAVLATLRAALADPDPWVCYYACQSLGKHRDAGATAELVALTGHASGQVRVAAIEALAHLRAPEATAALRRAAASADPDLRRAALVGLGLSRDPSVLPVLVDAAERADRATRLVALSGLAEQDHPDALAALARAALDADEAIREAAVGHVAEWHGPGGTPVLVALLASPATRERAREALAVPAEGRIAGLLAALEGADAELAGVLVSALARMNRADARAALATALEMRSPHARRAAAEALAAIEAPEAHPALARAATLDPDPDVRRHAASALLH